MKRIVEDLPREGEACASTMDNCDQRERTLVAIHRYLSIAGSEDLKLFLIFIERYLRGKK